MRYAIIENGKVVNIILSDSPVGVPALSDTGIGDSWDGVNFTKPSPKPPAVPDAVTMRQARLALMAAGLLTSVNAAIANMPGSTGDAARITWEFSSEVQRNNPFVLSLGLALGLNSVQLDQLFITAATL